MFLIVIILLSGQEVHLNPREVIALIEARQADDKLKHYAPGVRCVVETTGEHQYTTKEECSSIQKRLESRQERP